MTGPDQAPALSADCRLAAISMHMRHFRLSPEADLNECSVQQTREAFEFMEYRSYLIGLGGFAQSQPTPGLPVSLKTIQS
jgi:hypothetical protein